MTLQVANTILAQLGGSKFRAMTGAKTPSGSDDSLSMRLPSGFASNRCNGFRVTLNSRDLYDLRFYRIRGAKFTELEGATDIGVENLRSVFESMTGLRTRL